MVVPVPLTHQVCLGSLPALERQLFSDIIDCKKDDPLRPVVVLVESNLAGIYLRRRLAGSAGSHCRVEFLTFSDLARRFAAPAAAAEGLEPLPRFGEEWLAALLASRAGQGYFSSVAGRPGFLRALRQTFQELSEAGLEQLTGQDAGDGRLAALDQLCRQYRELLKPFLHSALTYRLARDAVQPGEAPLFIYGHYHLSCLQLDLLAALAAGNSVNIYWQQAALEQTAPVELLARLERLGFKRWPLTVYNGDSGKADAAHRLQETAGLNSLARLQESGFYAGPTARQSPPGELAPWQSTMPKTSSSVLDPQATPASGDESLKFISASDQRREVFEIAREILSLAGRGVRFAEMAVAVRNASYYPLLTETLSAAGIPCYLPAGASLSRTRAGRGLLLFLDLAGSGCERAAVIELLTCAPFRYDRLLESIRPVSPAYWDYLSLKAGVTRGREQWFSALDRCIKQLQSTVQSYAETDGSERGEQLEAMRLLRRFLEMLFGELDRLPASGSWAAFTAACRLFLRRFFAASEECELLLRTLKQLARLDRFDEQVDLAAARDLLGQVLESVVISRGSFQGEGVNLLPVAAVASMRFAAVFIPGLVEKGFPAAIQMDPLFPEAERKALSGMPLRRQRREHEMLSFILAVNSAETQLVISWFRLDNLNNQERQPSPFLLYIGERLLGSRLSLNELGRLPGYRRISFDDAPGDQIEAVNASEYDLACCESLAMPEALSYLCALGPAPARCCAAERSQIEPSFTPYQGMLSGGGEAARELAARLPRTLAATQLEDYARCPYYYYLRRVLRLQPLEEAEELVILDPLERGLLVHRILEQFYRALRRRGLPAPAAGRDAGPAQELLAEICGGHFASLGLAATGRVIYPLLWELEQEYLLKSLQALLAWESEQPAGPEPCCFELPFGTAASAGDGAFALPPGAFSPVVLKLPGGGELNFRGRIDRVDWDGRRRLRLIDYKSGRKKNADESLEGGAALQLPLYLLAARRLFGLDNLEQAEACYYHLSPEGIKVVRFSGGGWPDKERRLAEIIAVLYRGMAAGQFFPYPGEQEQNCTRCDYYRFTCGPGIGRLFRHKAADQRLRPFLRLKE